MKPIRRAYSYKVSSLVSVSAKALLLALLVLPSTQLFAADALTAFKVTGMEDGTSEYSVTLQIMMIMTALTVLPSLLMMMSSFTRIIIVFAIMRQAIGLQQTPSNQILLGLALFLTFFIMTPVFERINETALTPYMNEEMGSVDAVKAAAVPLRKFMLAQTRETDLALFLNIANKKDVASIDEVGFFIIVPAFITSELKTAFQMGFMLFIPFLIIDLVVASVLMAMGMMMLSPIIISLPFKIMLFVLVDGWAMLMGSLASSFAV